MNIQAIELAGQIEALNRAIDRKFFLIRKCSEGAIKEDFFECFLNTEKIHIFCNEIDDLLRTYRKRQQELKAIES